MENIVHSSTGAFHLFVSVLSLIFGTYILFAKKGTTRHRKVGYLYFWSMTLMLITAFMIYDLFGKFGMFHWMAVVSTLTLIGGMIPMFFNKKKEWIETHYSFMYWSVMGLYAAFISEIMTRLPNPKWSFLFISLGVTMGFGSYYFSKYKKIWKERFLKS